MTRLSALTGTPLITHVQHSGTSAFIQITWQFTEGRCCHDNLLDRVAGAPLQIMSFSMTCHWAVRHCNVLHAHLLYDLWHIHMQVSFWGDHWSLTLSLVESVLSKLLAYKLRITLLPLHIANSLSTLRSHASDTLSECLLPGTYLEGCGGLLHLISGKRSPLSHKRLCQILLGM